MNRRETKRDVLNRFVELAKALARDVHKFPKREVAGFSKDERKELTLAGELFRALGHALTLRGCLPTAQEKRAMVARRVAARRRQKQRHAPA
jgi:hypothetical protein